jgi:YesN/AraC family two-component response regulator
MKIVIADDSALWRERIKSMLSCINGISVIYEACNGVEALQYIIEEKPEFVILDIRMPEKTGIDVLMKIRELNMKIKVCILTNYPYPQYKRRCLEEGADYFLSKTDDFNETIIIKMLKDE